MVQIQPVVKSLEWFKITSVSVTLDESAVVSYIISDNTSLGLSGQLFMDTDVYQAWGNNDEYVVMWALAELGLRKA